MRHRAKQTAFLKAKTFCISIQTLFFFPSSRGAKKEEFSATKHISAGSIFADSDDQTRLFLLASSGSLVSGKRWRFSVEPDSEAFSRGKTSMCPDGITAPATSWDIWTPSSTMGQLRRCKTKLHLGYSLLVPPPPQQEQKTQVKKLLCWPEKASIDGQRIQDF